MAADRPDARRERRANRWEGFDSNWAWTMGVGVLLAIAGIVSLGAPGTTTVAIAMLLGWILLVTGIAGIVIGFRTANPHRRWIDLLYGAASLLVGLFMLIDPVAGAASLTLVLAVWLAFRGVVDLSGAARIGPGRLRGTLAIIGVLDLLLAVLLLLSFPFPAVQMLGTVVGLSLLMAGLVAMLAAWQLRKMATGA